MLQILGILIGDFLMKRVVIIKDRDQVKRFMDKRLAYFTVRIEMNKKFDFNDLQKFVKCFELLDELSEIFALTSSLEDMKIGGEERKFEVIKELLKERNYLILTLFSKIALLNIFFDLINLFYEN
jgi:hypothetical protein